MALFLRRGHEPGDNQPSAKLFYAPISRAGICLESAIAHEDFGRLFKHMLRVIGVTTGSSSELVQSDSWRSTMRLIRLLALLALIPFCMGQTTTTTPAGTAKAETKKAEAKKTGHAAHKNSSEKAAMDCCKKDGEE